MNIDSIVFSDAYDMPLRHPSTDEPLLMTNGKPMFIRVASDDSPVFKRMQAAYRNEALRKPGKRMTAEKEDARMTELMVACTLAWRMEGASGPVDFTPEAARALYQDKLWIRNQVIVAIFDDANFLGESKAA